MSEYHHNFVNKFENLDENGQTHIKIYLTKIDPSKTLECN